jgi:hypothetical protein
MGQHPLFLLLHQQAVERPELTQANQMVLLVDLAVAVLFLAPQHLAGLGILHQQHHPRGVLGVGLLERLLIMAAAAAAALRQVAAPERAP